MPQTWLITGCSRGLGRDALQAEYKASKDLAYSTDFDE